MERVVWLIRHGNRLDFEDPQWAARASRPHDPPLSIRGYGEAAVAADRLASESVGSLFSSPFLRCVETADAIAIRLGIRIGIEPGLSEWLNREWFSAPPALLTISDLARQFPSVDPTHRPRGAACYGESGEEALHRSAHTARTLAESFPGSLALVGHGASLLGAAMGLLEVERAAAPELGYGEMLRLVQLGTRWRLAPNEAEAARIDG